MGWSGRREGEGGSAEVGRLLLWAPHCTHRCGQVVCSRYCYGYHLGVCRKKDGAFSGGWNVRWGWGGMVGDCDIR